ncbi:MAG: hypothetical protein ACKO9I_06570 [Sphaerospermopsis kisseleviana]|jgi:hypothetical protein|uniref:Lipoprotein n=1 Tax=Sphaerospermopsis reniformis TaxID=531300 RepID=A0A480A805_9CYAN|nr:hypothetical protein [Sphaerospermopsis reniformis]GCL39331.1 hypothetical protein SR1949_44570 [Sphaerospermopsis reniformis]
MMGSLKSTVIILIIGISLSGCGAKVKICNQDFSQGQKLPLKYSEISKDFLSALKEHTNADPNDIAYVNKLFFGNNQPIYKVAAYWSQAGLGSNGDKVFVQDAQKIQSFQESIRWQQFEKQAGLCELMR